MAGWIIASLLFRSFSCLSDEILAQTSFLFWQQHNDGYYLNCTSLGKVFRNTSQMRIYHKMGNTKDIRAAKMIMMMDVRQTDGQTARQRDRRVKTLSFPWTTVITRRHVITTAPLASLRRCLVWLRAVLAFCSSHTQNCRADLLPHDTENVSSSI